MPPPLIFALVLHDSVDESRDDQPFEFFLQHNVHKVFLGEALSNFPKHLPSPIFEGIKLKQGVAGVTDRCIA